MSLSVSSRMAHVKPSATGALLARAKALRAAGVDLISLGTGEPDFDTPDHIKTAAINAIKAGETKYTAIDGTPELKAAICSKLRRDNNLDYVPDDIVVTSGAKQSIFNLCLAILNPDDEVIIPAPYWVSYSDIVHIAEARPIVLLCELEDDFKLTPARLRAALSEKTRLVMLNSPSNPTGACYSKQELADLGAVLTDYPDVCVLSDEIYEHIHWAATPFASFAEACPSLKDRTITVNGVSKAYAMTGWRIGYAAGPAQIIQTMKVLQSQSTSNASSVSQAAAAEALSASQDCVGQMAAEYRQRHDFMCRALNDIPGFDCIAGDGTFYSFPRITTAMRARGVSSDAEFAEFLINEALVATVPGSAFGAAGYLRLSFASSMEQLKTAMERIKAAIVA